MASEEERAALSISRGKTAAGMQPGQTQRDFIAAQGEQEKSGSDRTKDLEASNFRQSNMNAVKGSFNKGGKVKSTGLYKLHAGETVVPHGKNAVPVKKGSAAMAEHDEDC